MDDGRNDKVLALDGRAGNGGTMVDSRGMKTTTEGSVGLESMKR